MTDSGLKNAELGRIVEKAYDAEWTEGNRDWVGKNFRAWAKAAGIAVASRGRQVPLFGPDEDRAGPSAFAATRSRSAEAPQGS
jgi:hypothetical protein